MGSGLGWIDYDRDGCPDMYLAQGAPWTGELRPAEGPEDQLFRQRSGRFLNVTDHCGVVDRAYGMGVTVGDFNADGFPDLYVSNFGPNRLFINDGDGTFSDVSAVAGVGYGGYSASSTWFDADSDGLLDLFVANYLQVDVSDYRICHEPATTGAKLAIPCPPWTYPGDPDRFYRNLGDGRFADETVDRGIAAVDAAHGLGVVVGDFDADGDVDLYVANDADLNHLWMNDGEGQFEELGLLAGTAVNADGAREAGMGVAAGDVTGDGLPELFVTNYFAETNTLYRNEGLGFFSDVSSPLGVGGPSRARLGFGTAFLDVDNDDDLDLFIANGHLHDRLSELGREVPYQQPPQLLQFGDGRFEDVSEIAGEPFRNEQLGRGVAVADYDGDGLMDVAVSRLHSTVSLLKNVSSRPGHWLQVGLVGTSTHRDSIGARVAVRTSTGRSVRFRDGSSSYLSTHDSMIHFGLADSESVDAIEVRWPRGQKQEWRGLPCGARVLLVEGLTEVFRLPDR
ncbi:MAG: CRTAC1 family protein [Planctomycetaceae bacterium]|nr:CRTAC1 family protein [Planctomycetaceae bacterium]